MICLATADDREAFSILWAEFLRDSHKLGSDMLPTPRNLLTSLGIFDLYMNGELDGVVMMAFDEKENPIGTVMSGAMTPVQMFDSSYGRMAAAWGHYVKEEHRGNGVALDLNRATAQALKDLNFDVAIGPVLDQNPASMKTSERVGAHNEGNVMVVYMGGK